MKTLFESWRRFNENKGCQNPLELCYYKRTTPPPGTEDKKYFHLALQHAKALLIKHDPGYKTMLEMTNIYLYNSINSYEHMNRWFILDKKGKDTAKRVELTPDEESAVAIPAILDTTGAQVYGANTWDSGLELSIGNFIKIRNYTFNSEALKVIPERERAVKDFYVWTISVVWLAGVLVHEFHHLTDIKDPRISNDDNESIYVGDLPKPWQAFTREERIEAMVPREKRAFKSQATFLSEIAEIFHQDSHALISNMIKYLAGWANNIKINWNYGD